MMSGPSKNRGSGSLTIKIDYPKKKFDFQICLVNDDGKSHPLKI